MPPQKRLPKDQDLCFQRILGQLIRERRKPSHNQDDFADQVGIYRSHMGLIEQGKLDLRLSTLLAVSDALQLPLSDLLQQVEERLKASQGPQDQSLR